MVIAPYIMQLRKRDLVPRNHANKNTPHKNNDFTPFFAIKSIENITKNAIQIP